MNEVDKALEHSNKAIELDPTYANAWYNRSCYMVKKGEINEALKNLEEAIKLDSANIESSKTDKDFDSIRDNAKFKKLVGVS